MQERNSPDLHSAGASSRVPSALLVALLVLLPPGLVGCSSGHTLTGPDTDADVRVLFVGNSLTYTNDLPAMVREIAAEDGTDLAYATVLAANSSLGDHWRSGVEDVIRDVGADVVVLQQGPSSLPRNREHLRTWTEAYAPVVTESGGRVALYMVWPSSERTHAFDAVREAYRGAAEAVDGLFAPAGETWRAVWRRTSSIDLYGPDGFHPTRAGTFAAALTVYGSVAGNVADGLPCPGLAALEGDLTEAERRTVCDAAEEALSTHGF